MLKRKNIFTILFWITFPFTVHCAQQPDWNTQKLEQEFIKTQRENDLWLQAGSNIGGQSVKGVIDAFSNATSGSLIELAKREIDLLYDGRPTTEAQLSRYNATLTLLSNTLELIPKNITLEIDRINNEIATANKNQLLAPQDKKATIDQLEQAKINLRLQERQNVAELNELRQNVITEYREYTAGRVTPKTLQKKNDQAQIDNTKSENPNKTEQTITSASTESPEQKDNAQQPQSNETPKENNKGIIAKIGAFICPPIVASGIDVVAKTCGAQSLANMLGSNIPMFKGKEEFISRSLVVTGTVATCMALYKLYQSLTDEDTEDDELDFFEKNGFGTQAQYR